MKYFTDKPIENNSDDLLGRASFSERVGETIYNFDAEDGLVIGLYGSWGSGKTSVVNMIVNHIEEKSTDNKPLIIKFEPWNYLDGGNLISIFFRNLKEHIEIEGNKELKKREVAEKLKDYADAFDAASIIPVIGPGLAALLKSVVKVQGENLSKVPSLEETKKKVEQALSELDNKIIVVIDDIDRLTNSQIRDIFQLVKQLGDFPNIVYVLVMEREVVARALNKVHNVDGNEYLEKIIQVPFEIPELNKYKVHKILKNKLDEIIKDTQEKNSYITINDEYYKLILQNCVNPYVRNLRDINRFINIFQFKYGALYNEVSFEDLIAITSLEVLEPSLYNWVFEHKLDLCGEISNSYFLDDGKEEENNKYYYNEFKKMGIDSDLALHFLSTLFPKFKRKIDKFAYFSNLNTRKENRVANVEKFDLYFSFNLEDVKIPRVEIDSIIYKKNKNDLFLSINDIYADGNVNYLLDEIEAKIDEVPYDRLHLILYVLLHSTWEINPKIDKSEDFNSLILIIERFIFNALKGISNKNEIYKFIIDSIKTVDEIGLATIGITINKLHNYYSGDEASVGNNQIVSREQLFQLENIYIEKLKRLKFSEFIAIIKINLPIFYFWERIDKSGLNKYLKESVTNDLNKLNFTCALAEIWIEGPIQTWTFNEERYSRFISKEDIYSIIKNLDKNTLNKFSREDQIKLAIFILLIDNNSEIITKKEASKYLDSHMRKS
ncbi:P-loop NTPase fold protein [uncultured Anaerococcus sp.]|uniref:KAP family P-loop NTPase fold protein n=1 Tax=uncultured Anaerococcus sp. TaxID=293428 RepID=UPI002601486A|nr:P-loop NTPase fold protein [uncultured Anaerococcus sp.]